MRKLGFAILVALLPSACKGPMAKIEALRDALVSDDAGAIRSATTGYPSCTGSSTATASTAAPSTAPCLAEIANALGSRRGFVSNPPDHAGASTAALVLVRDGRGDWLPPSDPWLITIKTGRGIGTDILRLAIARQMAEAAPTIGRKIEDEPTARTALLAVTSSIPGACPTYWLLAAAGTDVNSIPPELSADHSACVQKDLSRREGPGGGYGTGTFRALEGALALWRETERALRMGVPQAEPGPKAVLEQKLAVIEAATAKIETKKLAGADSAADRAIMAFMQQAHSEAGVAIVKSDAGADDDAGPPAHAAPKRPR